MRSTPASCPSTGTSLSALTGKCSVGLPCPWSPHAAPTPESSNTPSTSTLLDEDAIARLAARAREQAAEGGLKLLGSDGLLQSLTKQIIEAALEAELDEHLRADPPHSRS